MSRKLSPSFGDELVAAGLGGLPFLWHPDGRIEGREALSKTQQATLDRVLAAHDPDAVRSVIDAAYIDAHVHSIEDVRAVLKMMLRALPPIGR